MKRLLTIPFLFISILLSAQDLQVPISTSKINTTIEQHLSTTQTVFDWNKADLHLMWSALVNTDSTVVIGYQTDAPNFLRSLKEFDKEQKEWSTAKTKIVKTIQDYYIAKNGGDPSGESNKLIYDNNYLPNILIKVYDMDLIKILRAMKEVRYVEVSNFEFNASIQKSDLGCSDYSATVNPTDYTPISPQSIQSWHHLPHQVDCAWNISNQGDNITVAVFDSGVSGTNPKFNAEFTEGQSGGRTITKYGFYPPNVPDGWQDQCGHGSAMSGLVAAPRGFDNTPAGVAYKCDFISYRVTNDVVINASDEYNALANALTHATNNTNTKIASMSLGDVVSHGPVTTAIQYAHANGMMIFAAAGTSTCATSWYPVVFPAWMPETVAVTGAIENTAFDNCCECHDGNEVDFTVYMERAGSGNNSITITNDDVNSYFRGAVGGSSSATATMAGIGALVWANNPTLDKNQILNRLIQSSSEYPNRNSNFGWGAINVCEAADASFNLPCAASISNSVTLSINEITFPQVDDNFLDTTAEWIIDINGTPYYFEVPTSGATGNPSSYNVTTNCTAAPIIIDLGNVSCGQGAVNITVETFEDDFGISNCSFGSGDDERNISTASINFNQSTFTTPGGFSFSYSLSCTPTLLADIDNNSPACFGTNITFTAGPAGMTNYEFYLDSNQNGILDAGESMQSSPNPVFINNSFSNLDVIGVIVTDANGCNASSATTALVSPANLAGANKLVGTEILVNDYETDGIIESVQLIASTARVDYDSKIYIDLLPGFQTILGSNFMAFIDGCNDGAGGINLIENPTGIEQAELEEKVGNQ